MSDEAAARVEAIDEVRTHRDALIESIRHLMTLVPDLSAYGAEVMHVGVLTQQALQRHPPEARDAVQKLCTLQVVAAVSALRDVMEAQPAGSRNYVTVSVHVGAMGSERRFSLTLQREDGMTPADKIRDLEDDVARLTAELTAAREAVK